VSDINNNADVPIKVARTRDLLAVESVRAIICPGGGSSDRFTRIAAIFARLLRTKAWTDRSATRAAART
jgi:hypothetical protein